MHYHEDSPNQIFSTFSVDPITNVPMIVVDWNNRATQNGSFIVERSVSASSAFEPIAELPADATTFTDLDVETGKTYTYRMYTTRTDGTLLHGYPTRVRVIATVQAPFNGTAISIPGTLEVEEYNIGGEGLAYHDTEPANIPGGFRVDEGVDIGALGDGFILEYVAADEWLEYTVNVAEAGIYNVEALVASEISNGTFSITFDKNNATANFNAPNTGGWNAFQPITATGEIELEAGEQQLRLTITNDNPFNIDKLTFNLKTTVSVTNLDAAQAGFKASPNPTKGELNIELSNTLQNKQVQLELFSMTGKKVGTFNTTGASTTLDLSRFASGFYLLQLVGADINLVHRIVIE